MNEAKLTRMANQVADFFRAYPEDQAVAGIHEHLVAFWTRNMLRDLAAHAAAGAPEVDPLVARAMREETWAKSPVRKAVAGPGEAGEMVSDAG